MSGFDQNSTELISMIDAIAAPTYLQHNAIVTLQGGGALEAGSWFLAGAVSMVLIATLALLLSLRRHARHQQIKAQFQKRLADKTRQLTVLNHALDEHAIVSMTDRNGKLIYVNDAFCTITGYQREELLGRDHSIINSSHHDPKIFCEMYLAINQGKTWHSQILNRSKDGSLHWMDTTIVPAFNEAGEIERFVAIRSDVTDRVKAEEALIQSQQRYELAVNGSRDGLWDWNLRTGEIYYAPRWKQMLGLENQEVTSRPDEWISRIVSDDLVRFQSELNRRIDGDGDEFECDLRMIHTDGDVRWMLCRGAVVRDEITEKAIRIAGSLADITEIKKAQQALRHAAEHDRLTNLANREVLMNHIQNAINRWKRNPDAHFAVLFFDFDRFKVVNDSLGHDVGDSLLVAIAERLRNTMRTTDIAARFGGDEFVVLLENIHTLSEATDAAQRLLKLFAEPFDINGHDVVSTASIGLVTSEMVYDRAEDVIRDADAAMYQAKAAGRGQVVLFDRKMHEQALDRLSIEEDLRGAVDRSEFVLVYQPIIELVTGRLEGFEALVRWEHPTRGLVCPDDFIPIAEDTGLIVYLGQWVINEASRQLADWRHRLIVPHEISLNVNVSKRQLCHPEIVPVIERAIRVNELEPRMLKIEITESTIVDNRRDMVPLLERIHDIGVAIAMDDFGTGHSSLSGLHQFPIDILKIDRSFIQSMEKSRDLAAVVHAIISLAKHLGMTIVAEGVETADHVVALQTHGCDLAQGYFFSRPLSVAQAEAYMLDLSQTKRIA